MVRKSREESVELLNEYVKSKSLKKHCFSVAFAMEAYAEKYQLDKEEINKYFITGLLHDFDFERFPSLEKHPYKGVKILKEKGYDESVIEAIMGHGNHTGVKRESKMAKTLFAVDELCGLIIALAYVRPMNFEGMTAKSVKKAFKKKEFAKGVNRDDILEGVEDLGVDMIEHFEFVVGALRNKKEELGF